MQRLRDFEGRTALVTGGAGFVGSHLCKLLTARGATAHSASRRAAVSGGVPHHSLDITNSAAVRELFAEVRPDFVFHLAGDSRAARDLSLVLPTFQSNLAATVNVLLAGTEHKSTRIVLAGSLEEPTARASENVPSSPYAASKLAGSHYARMFHALYQTPVTVARIFMVYGPGQYDLRKLVPYVTVSLLSGRPPKLSAGSRNVDWVYVQDVAMGLAGAALNEELAGQTVDLGTGVLTNVADVAMTIARLVDSELEPQLGAIPRRPNEQVRRGDRVQMQRLLGDPPITDLEEGLRRTVSWYREEFRAGRLDLSAIDG